MHGVSRARRQWLVLPGQWWDWTEHRASTRPDGQPLSHCWWDTFNFGATFHGSGMTAGSGSLTRGRTRTFCIGSMGSSPLDRQGVLARHSVGAGGCRRPGMVDASSQGRKSKAFQSCPASCLCVPLRVVMSVAGTLSFQAEVPSWE